MMGRDTRSVGAGGGVSESAQLQQGPKIKSHQSHQLGPEMSVRVRACVLCEVQPHQAGKADRRGWIYSESAQHEFTTETGNRSPSSGLTSPSMPCRVLRDDHSKHNPGLSEGGAAGSDDALAELASYTSHSSREVTCVGRQRALESRRAIDSPPAINHTKKKNISGLRRNNSHIKVRDEPPPPPPNPRREPRGDGKRSNNRRRRDVFLISQ